MQCMGNSGCFPRRKRAAVVRRYPASPSSCPPPPPSPVCSIFRVSISSAVRPTLLRQMDMGSFSCAQMWVHAVYTRRVSDTKKSAQEVTRRDIHIACRPLPARGSNPGSWVWNSEALTTEPRPLYRGRCRIT